MPDDMINHPTHYRSHPSGVECITITEHMGFNLGNALKYIWRADEKGKALEDLGKAEFYIKREIEKRRSEVEGQQDQSKPFLADHNVFKHGNYYCALCFQTFLTEEAFGAKDHKCLDQSKLPVTPQNYIVTPEMETTKKHSKAVQDLEQENKELRETNRALTGAKNKEIINQEIMEGVKTVKDLLDGICERDFPIGSRLLIKTSKSHINFLMENYGILSE